MCTRSIDEKTEYYHHREQIRSLCWPLQAVVEKEGGECRSYELEGVEGREIGGDSDVMETAESNVD